MTVSTAGRRAVLSNEEENTIMMDRNLTLNLVRVTEAAAISCSQHLGRGDKNMVDAAAVESMRFMFDDLNINGEVVIGEGEMDEAPMLYIGERIGTDEHPKEMFDIAVDPVDGTSLVAKGLGNAISVVAAAPKGALLHAPDMYMDKMVTGKRGKDFVSMEWPIDVNLRLLSKALDKDISELTVSILERERHYELIRKIRRLGARIKLFQEGDVAAALATCIEGNDVDLMVGSGGAPEGVIAAVGVKAMGGMFQGRLLPKDEEQIRRCRDMGIEDYDKILEMDDLVNSDDALFAATGVTDGDFLPGVVHIGKYLVRTTSMVLRVKTGTVRVVTATHDLKKKPEFNIELR